MKVAAFLQRLEGHGDKEAIVDGAATWTYRELLDAVRRWETEFSARGIVPGTVVSLESDHSLNGIGALLALMSRQCIIVPLVPGADRSLARLREIAQIEMCISVDESTADVTSTKRTAGHPLYNDLRAAYRAGMVLYTSGTTADPKAVVHDLERVLGKFTQEGRAYRTLAFLRFDHIGGIDTIFYTLASGGAVVCPRGRAAHDVCAVIEEQKVEVLPASPSFLRLMFAAGGAQSHDLSSLQIVTYGTEVMPPPVLEATHKNLPRVRLLQRYGLSELGALRSRSESDQSPWLQLDPRTKTRIVDGLLEVKTGTAMLGYLNAPSPFTADGWFRTGDMVEVNDQGFMRILGRASDVINVAGRKVHPREVEDVITGMPEVLEATAYGVENPFLGAIVGLRVRLASAEAAEGFEKRAWALCQDRLPDYKVPRIIDIEDVPAP